MKKIAFLVLLILLTQLVAVSALNANEAKQEWQDAKQVSKDAQVEHQDAKIDYAADQTPENNQIVVDTGKVVLNAALDEVEAWLTWKNLEAEENSEVPEEIKSSIEEDVNANLAKIDALRLDVENVNTQFELGVTFLKMIGKYLELLAGVARNTGAMWVHIGNEKADTIENYEAKLRVTAEEIEDNAAILEKLDLAKSELEMARNNINNAETVYKQVKVPGTPLLKFSEGNNYLQAAKINLISAHGHLNGAFILIKAR